MTTLANLGASASAPASLRPSSLGRLIQFMILAALTSLALVGCDNNPSSNVTSTFEFGELQLTPNQAQIDNHTSVKLDLRRVMDDGRSVPASGSVTWRSSSPAVATVSQTGEVTARLPGAVTITAETPRGSAQARIEIIPTNQDLRLIVDDSVAVAAGPDGIRMLNARVEDVTGRPISGVQVDFQIMGGDATIHPARVFTDDEGSAQTTLTPGTAAGAIDAEITSPGLAPASAMSADGVAAPFWESLRRWFRIVVTPSYPASVDISPSTVTVEAGQKTSFSAVVRDSYGNTIASPSIVWSSSNTQRAPVSTSGEVTGMSATTAQITATASDAQGRSASGSGEVRVTAAQSAPTLAGIAVVGGNNQSGTVGNNLASALAVRAVDSNGNAMANVPVSWSVIQGAGTLGASSSSSSSTGMATTTLRLGTSAGSVQIRAAAAGVTPVTFTATAQAGAVASVSVNPGSATLAEGESLNLQASARDQHGNPVSGATFQWSSTSTSVATVGSTGRVTARASGSAQIRAQSGSVTGATAITVPQTSTPTPTPPPADTTTNPGGGETTNPGQVTDLRVHSASASSITLRFTEVSNGAGGAALYHIRYQPTNSTQPWEQSTSVDSSTCRATLDQPLRGTGAGNTATCAVDGLAPGTSYTFVLVAFRVDNGRNVYGAVSNYVPGSTSAAPQPVPGVSTLRISAPTTSLTSLGQQVQLSVSALDGSGSAVSTPSVSWSSSNPSVATVNSSGRVIANAVGTALISVAAACCSTDQVSVTVTQQVASVEVSPGSVSLVPGQTRQFSATARDANGNAVPGVSLSWTTSNGSVANVTAGGMVAAVGAGSAQVRASAAGRVGAAGVSVGSTTTNPGGGSTPWYVQNWDYSSTSAMKAAAHSVTEGGGGTVSLQSGDMGSGTPSGRFMRANYGSSGLGDGRSAGLDFRPSGWRDVQAREVWFEVMVRHDQAWRIHSDDKTFFFLEDWSAAGGAGEQSRWGLFMRDTQWYGGPTASFPAAYVSNTPNRSTGQWERLRVHLKMGSNRTAADGAFRVWLNNTLVINAVNIVTGSHERAFFGNFALGRNADPQGSGIRDWGRVQIYISDPGW